MFFVFHDFWSSHDVCFCCSWLFSFSFWLLITFELLMFFGATDEFLAAHDFFLVTHDFLAANVFFGCYVFLTPMMPKNHDRVNPPLRRVFPPLRRGFPPLRFCSCMIKFILHSWAAAHVRAAHVRVPPHEPAAHDRFFPAHEQLLMCMSTPFFEQLLMSVIFFCTWVAAHECYFFCTWVAAHAWVPLCEQLLVSVICFSAHE